MERPPAGPIPNRLALAAWLLLPIAAHLGFSSFGFNPTDDGFILAMSRRLLDGQIPHRDFISIRPVGSSLLHLPEVWLGGALTLWLGRFVTWCEFGVIAFCGVDLAARVAREPIAPTQRLLVGAVAFMLASHTFPIMPWHTVDALALVSLGAWLAARPGRLAPVAGLFLVGASALCRQNFLLLPPVAILCLGHARSWRAWLAAFAAPALYVAVLAAAGALPDAALQLTTRMEVVRWGVTPYLKSAPMWGGVAAGIALALALESRPPVASRPRVAARHVIGILLVAAIVAAAGWTMLMPATDFIQESAFVLFGLGAGQLAALLAVNRRDPRLAPLALALATAWSASVSIGYGSPALALANVFGVTFHAAVRPFDLAARLGRRSRAPRAIAIGLALALSVAWIPARLQRIYRDRPAGALDWPLGDVLPGGARIMTNGDTYEFLEDLGHAVRSIGDREAIVVPDCAAWWIRSPRPNPLPSDWPLDLEVSRPELVERVLAAMRRDPGRRRILLAKVYAGRLDHGFVPLPDDARNYGLVRYVRTSHRKVGETRWWEVYQ